jgi:hypothetical protein
MYAPVDARLWRQRCTHIGNLASAFFIKRAPSDLESPYVPPTWPDRQHLDAAKDDIHEHR